MLSSIEMIWARIKAEPDIGKAGPTYFVATVVPGIAIPGWPGCHVIAKLIFVAFNRRGDISANLAIPANRASPAHVIRPLGYG